MRPRQLDPDEAPHERPALPEQFMWAECLRLAVYDAEGPSERRITQESLQHGETRRDEARRWLRSHRETLELALLACQTTIVDFREVCLPHLEKRWLACDAAWSERQEAMAEVRKAA